MNHSSLFLALATWVALPLLLTSCTTPLQPTTAVGSGVSSQPVAPPSTPAVPAATQAVGQRASTPMAATLPVAHPTNAPAAAAPVPKPFNPEYPDFYTGGNGGSTKGIDFVQAIAVTTPAYCSDIKGDTSIKFKAPGMTTAKALCWQQPTKDKPGVWGHDVDLAPELKLDAEGNGSFVFHADQFPNGPLTIRIQAKDDTKKQDICELQVFNQGGVVWNQGAPKTTPSAAQGMKLVYVDDFDGPLSIAPNGKMPDGSKARYLCHKTGGGDFSGWPFSDNAGANNPFSQTGTFLRIHASKKPGTKGSTGILSSILPDGTGVTTTPPFYMECRFVCQSAPGTWPAFWTLTKGGIGMDKNSDEFKALPKGGDELDIIEAYGGYGPKNPNSGGKYSITTHFWNQAKPEWVGRNLPDGKILQSHTVVDTLQLGGKSSWSWTFHTYGLRVDQTDTVYYFDDIEVLRHPTLPISKAQPTWFLINYAIGGISGWKIDMERYGNASDMWVDYVRVYQGQAK